RGFSRTVRAEEAEDLAALHAEREIVERGNALAAPSAPILLAQPLELQRRRHPNILCAARICRDAARCVSRRTGQKEDAARCVSTKTKTPPLARRRRCVDPELTPSDTP